MHVPLLSLLALGCVAFVSHVQAQDLGWASGSMAKSKADAIQFANAAAAGQSLDDQIQQWFSSWKLVYGKVYATIQLESIAFRNFQANMLRMLAINGDPNIPMWSTGNKFSDLDYAAFATKYLMKPSAVEKLETAPTDDDANADNGAEGASISDTSINGISRKTRLSYRRALQQIPPSVESSAERLLPADLPNYVDWRDRGVVTPVKDQGECGGCWAYCAAAATESAWLITWNMTADDYSIDLSEQQLIDCANAASGWGSFGCDGGSSGAALSYIQALYLQPEADYPNIYETADCIAGPVPPEGSVQLASKPSYPRKYSERALMRAVAQAPTIVYFNVADDFYEYAGGVYVPNQQCMEGPVNHAMVAVGYSFTDSPETSYWIVRNSWSADWGQDGYVHIQMTGTSDGPCNMYSYSVRPRLDFSVPIDTTRFPPFPPTSPTPPPSPQQPLYPEEPSIPDEPPPSPSPESSPVSETSPIPETSPSSQASPPIDPAPSPLFEASTESSEGSEASREESSETSKAQGSQQ